jgi:hypothetical protein
MNSSWSPPSNQGWRRSGGSWRAGAAAAAAAAEGKDVDAGVMLGLADQLR